MSSAEFSTESSTQEPTFERPSRILIVEDDVTMEPLWRYVIEVAHPGAVVEWMTSAEAAEKRIQTLAQSVVSSEARFDLVISDIFLNGEKTGLDLWESSETENFILISVLSTQRLETLALDLRRPLPSYLQKPLDPNQCIETVRAFLKR